MRSVAYLLGISSSSENFLNVHLGRAPTAPRCCTDCAETLKALADRNPLPIVKALRVGPLSVGESVAVVDASHYNVSKPLGILRHADIVAVKPDRTRRHDDIVEDFRRQLSKKNRELDLGCGEFYFVRLETKPGVLPGDPMLTSAHRPRGNHREGDGEE